MTVDQSDCDGALIDVALRPLTVIEFHADRFLDYFRLHLNARPPQCVSPIDVSITLEVGTRLNIHYCRRGDSSSSSLLDLLAHARIKQLQRGN